MSEIERPLDPGNTARPCPNCGETVPELPHLGCVGLFKDVMTPNPAGRSSLDDKPAEVEEVADDPTRKLNQYVLVAQIGRGGMGIVWKAWDTKLTRWAAIKFLSAGEPADILRFEREAKLAARLRHPNIAAIFEVGESIAPVPGNPVQHYLAMEFIDGQPLSTADDRPVNDWLKVFVQVCRAVETAHQAGVVHRDLKPHNIMLTKEGYPYVMDFGLAKSLKSDTSLSASGAVMGTPSYMPPEQAQARHDDVDERSDTYSLGATLYSVLCKSYPFDGQSAIEVLGKVCNEEPRPPRELNPELPEEIETVLLKAMAKEKSDRYQSAGEFADDLQLYLSAGEVAAIPPSPLKKTFRKIRRSPITYGLTLAAAVLLAYFFFGGTTEPAAPPPSPDPEVQKQRVIRGVEDLWRQNRYKSALAFLEDPENAGHLTPEKVEEYRARTRNEHDVYVSGLLENFRRDLEDINRDADLRVLSKPQFQSMFELPPPDELFVEDNRTYTWARDQFPALEKVHEGADGCTLFDMAAAAVGLVSSGQNPWFKEVEKIAFENLHAELSRHLDRVQPEREADRKAREAEVKKLMELWDNLRKPLTKEFLERHGFLKIQEDDLTGLIGKWPITVEPEEIRKVAVAALTGRVRLSRLENARQTLVQRWDKSHGISVETKQTLYTWILILEAHRRLLLVETETEALEGKRLEEFGKQVWALGGPTDDYKAFGPAIAGVFDRLKPSR